MRHEARTLEVPTVNGTAGAARDIRDLQKPAVFLHAVGAVTFDFKLQVKVSAAQDSNDDWIDLTGSITAKGVYPIADQTTGAPLAVTHVRIYRTTNAVGTLSANVSGLNARTE